MWESACRWARPRLALLAGGELTGNDRRKVERHLIVCGDCRGRLESLQGALGALRGLASADTASSSPSLWPALARQIRESKHEEPKIFAFRPMTIGLAMAASALIVGMGTWSLVNRRDGSGANLIVSKKPALMRPAAVKPLTSETSSSTTVADVATSSKSESENVAVTPSSSPKSPSNGRIAVEPTH